jgi:GNAT superfamily N-acetyltransferase
MYRVEFRVERPLFADSEEHVVPIHGRILELEDEQEVGDFSAYVYDVRRADHDGANLLNEADALNADALEYYDAVFDHSGMIRGSVARLTGQDDVFPHNLLALHTVTVLPAHRGKGLGHACAQRIIDAYGMGCSIAVLRPKPLREDEDGPNDEQLPEPSPTGLAKLRNYWGKMGFKRIGRSEFYVRSLTLNHERFLLSDY